MMLPWATSMVDVLEVDVELAFVEDALEEAVGELIVMLRSWLSCPWRRWMLTCC